MTSGIHLTFSHLNLTVWRIIGASFPNPSGFPSAVNLVNGITWLQALLGLCRDSLLPSAFVSNLPFRE